MSLKNFKILLLPLVACSLFFKSCTIPCSSLPVVNHVFHADPGRDRAYNTVPVAYFNESWMAPGDKVWLEFPCKPKGSYTPRSNQISPALSNLTISREGDNKISLALGQFTTVAPPQYEEITIDFKYQGNIYFTFQVNIRPKNMILVKKGDANGNGKVDMLDLAAIAEGMFQGVTNSGTTATFPPHPDPDHKWVEPWESSWKWGGLVNEKIDFAHADLDFNGVIDINDFKVLEGELRPIDLDLFLVDGVNNAEFFVKRDPDQPIICFPSISGLPAHVEIPYIVVNGSDRIDSVLGIVHRRPLTENSCSRINGLKPELESGFFAASSADIKLLGHHELWRENNMHLERLCTKSGDDTLAVVDIAMFFTNTRNTLSPGQKIMDCIVELEDIQGLVTTGQCTVSQYDFDGIIFGKSPQGGVNITPTECTVSQLTVSPSDTCPTDTALTLVIRDTDTDYGREKGPIPVAAWASPDIKVTNLLTGVSDSIQTQTQADFEADLQIINLSCDTVLGGSVTLYWTEKGVNDPINPTNLETIETRPLPMILPRSKVDISNIIFNFMSVAPPLSATEITFIAIIDHPKDPAPPFSVGNPTYNLGQWVTHHNNVAALKLPIIP